MMSHVRLAGQIAALTVVFAIVSMFSDYPRYRQLPSESAIVKLSFTHVADRVSACRERTPEELAKLSPNMRKPLVCERRRGKIYVELDIDGDTIYSATLRPSGLAGDGPSRVYEKFVIPAGPHTVAVRMRDTPRTEGFDHARTGEVLLLADQNFVIDFSRESAGFLFR